MKYTETMSWRSRLPEELHAIIHRNTPSITLMSPLLKNLILTATAFLASCTYNFHTLNTADVLLHRDKQVVVSVQEEATVKYRYKGKNYYPIKLAYAVDKGDGVIRRACSPLACIPDTRSRYDIRQDSLSTYMCAVHNGTVGFPVGLYAKYLIPAQDFPFAQAEKIPLGKAVDGGDSEFSQRLNVYAYIPRNKTYEPVHGEVAGMPITQTEEKPAAWRRAVAVPLRAVDVAGTVVLIGVDVATGVLLLPVYAVKNAFEGKLHLE